MTTQQTGPPGIPERRRWVYILPTIHFVACLVAMSGYVIPALSFLGIIHEFINLIDLPISLVAFVLMFHNDALTELWILVAGTLWWYLLSILIERGRAKSRLSKNLKS